MPITKINRNIINRGRNKLPDWKKDYLARKGQILKKAYVTSCKYFSNIMTPDSNKAHKDHFHFDNGFGTKCYLKRIKK